MKKKVIAVIVAHPDDEAFFMSGTIAKYTKQGHDVYLLCATKGEEGEQHTDKDVRQVHEIREEELQESAKILGIKQVFFLGFRDGTLSNNLYHKIADSIIKILNKLKPELIISIEPRGISGHIDHIAISMISSYVFEKLPFVKKIMYFCFSKEVRDSLESYYIYFPPGYKNEEVNHIEDVSDVWEQKMKAIQSHKSQAKDAGRVMKRLNNFPKKEYFLVREK
jgi:LmbE family N-acetylglucosaminyl deacetylase